MDITGSGQTTCTAPFLPISDYPSPRGDISNRFCANLTLSSSTIECCLPCPATDWAYSDTYKSQSLIANYVSVASLVLNALLLLTFVVLPEEKSHRHYLSIGLTVSLMLIAIAFVIPLGTSPDFCYNDITPNDLHTDLSCGFTGAFVEAGAMGVVVWILLRSIWTLLRIMTKFRHQSFFRNASIALGIALPALFLAISLPISGVSYRLGNVCIPNRFSALATWFAWVMLFAAVSWVIQVVTIAYCLWRFASSIVTGPATVAGAGGGVKTHQSKSSVSTAVTAESAHTRGGTSITPARQRRVAWRKVKRVLVLQWRSMVLAFLIVNLSVFFGMAFIEQNLTTKALPGTENLSSADLTWFVCLMAHDGDKNACLSQASGLGLVERRAVATFVLGSCLGIVVPLLMIRWSMFVGWWELLRNPKTFFRRPSTGSEDFVMLSPCTLASQQMQGIDAGMRRRSSGQVVRASGESEGEVRTPTKTTFLDVPIREEGGKARGSEEGKKEEEVMV